MTSVAIISGAVARIEYLKEQVEQSESLQKGAEKLLQGLNTIKEGLIAAYDDKREKAAQFVGVEKKIVRLSYDIVEQLTSTVRLPTMLRRGQAELGDLIQKLDHLQHNLVLLENGAEQAAETTSSASLDSEETQNWESTKALLTRLRTELLSESPVVCILGESGMGKTTLARKLFHHHKLHPSAEPSFQASAWVSINHNFQIKKVLLALLQRLGEWKKADIRDMNEIELIAQIFAVLEKKKFLLVLDDIWSVDDWQSIRLALPISNSSKVIITTSSKEVAKVTTATEDSIFKIPGLIQSDILTILKETASFNPDSNVAKAVSDISGGSPLIATILGKSILTEADATASEQELVQELMSYAPHKGTPQVLRACYKRLSPELKPFLLYLAQFPQDQDVEVEKLYRLLAAEDLIMSPEESERSLQSREDVLEELARKKLVEVKDVASKRGIYKSCRLPDQVREFCKFKGSDEEFIEIEDFNSPKELGPNTRRLAIYMSKYRDDKSIPFSSHDTVKKIRSLLIFDKFESEQNPRWPSEINDLKEFSSLNVVSFDGVDFRIRKYPKGIDKLWLLRYLSFQGCWLEELPSSLSKLTNLETLDLLVHADCQMYIPSNILTNMKGLVHLYLPRLYVSDEKPKLQLLGSERLQALVTRMKEVVLFYFPRLHGNKPKLKLQLQGLERLETLVNLNTEVCDVEGLSQLKKLKILAAISNGEWEELSAVLEHFVGENESSLQQLSVDIRNFDRYNSEGVSKFKKLLNCPLLHTIRTKGQIGELTVEGGTPAPNIVEMVLNGSQLEHDPISVLGRFQNLRSLVLTNDAFVGSEIAISTTQFPNLRSLKLQNLQYLEKMRIQEGALPELSTLEIDRCRRLVDLCIPPQLEDRLINNGGDAYSVMPPTQSRPTSSHHQAPTTSNTNGNN